MSETSNVKSGAAVACSALLGCPMCGHPATFKAIQYTGVMASGMEEPDWTCGCVNCGLWLEKVSGSVWRQGKGTLNLAQEAKDELAEKWNRRIQPNAGAEARRANNQ